MVAIQAGGLVSAKARSGAAPKPKRFQLPSFLPMQNPKLVDAPPTGANRRHEIKLDGYRMQLRIGAPAWARAMMEVSDFLSPVDAKTFDLADEAAAWTCVEA